MNDITNQFAPEDIEQNKVISALSYLGILFFLPLVAAPESRFGKFHANQSLVILLLAVAGNIVIGILASILVFVWWRLVFISSILGTVFRVACLVYFILGLVFTLQGKAKELPLVGKIKIIKY